eukprot:g2237.t1
MTEVCDKRAQNIKALEENKLSISRSCILSKYLRIKESEKDVRKPFVNPKSKTSNTSQDLRRRLAARRLFIPYKSTTPFRPSVTPEPEPESASDDETPVPPVDDSTEALPEGVEPLVLWIDETKEDSRVEVDPILTKFLRPHQREGVQFMFECVNGLRAFTGQGCILADDMGLGKTLQGITLMWTLLRQGLGVENPVAKRAIVVCPTSLVSNWDHECNKWLKGRARVLGLSETSRENVISSLDEFLSKRNPYQVNFNIEFFAMVDFCNPGILGTRSHFHRHFETPILNGREPDATENEIELGVKQSEELSSLVNEFILRRTNTLLSEHLPPKIIQIVCCRLSPLQQSLYSTFLASKAAKRLLNGKSSGVLSAITSMKKLCNHPKLIYDQLYSHYGPNSSGSTEGFEDCEDLMPNGLFGRGTSKGLPDNWVEYSGKLTVLARMLKELRKSTDDRIVVVSNYTQTLDLIAIHCHEEKYPMIRLDGSVTIKKRQEMVMNFNNRDLDQFVFLLSSKAGGCGLNLIGANRLVLFDPDWNPATDKQAAARVWRDGQKKFVFVYRFLATGTIEEKVFQRQISKEGLQGLVNKNGKAATSALSTEELRDLFTFQKDTQSDTFDSICGTDLDNGEAPEIKYKTQEGCPAEDDLGSWSHHPGLSTVPDRVMQTAGDGLVSFIFACEVEGKELEVDSTPSGTATNENKLPKPILRGSLKLRNGTLQNLAVFDKTENINQTSHDTRKRKLEPLVPVLKRIQTTRPSQEP